MLCDRKSCRYAFCLIFLVNTNQTKENITVFGASSCRFVDCFGYLPAFGGSLYTKGSVFQITFGIYCPRQGSISLADFPATRPVKLNYDM